MREPRSSSSRGRAILLAIGFGALLGCSPAPPEGAVATASIRLVDAQPGSGLDFVHRNGMSGELFFVEMMGAGVGLLDYDRDGDLDLYLAQGHELPRPAEEPRLMDRLYRNDTEPGGPLRFRDVTAEAGIDATGYGMGVATGDVDNDGWVDLYVTNFGPNQLWRNRGDGTFEDVTRQAGVGGPQWSTSASFVDFDRDGWLDLYVVNYVRYSLADRESCRSTAGLPDYCSPLVFEAQPDRLFRNLGNGAFEDVTHSRGVASESGAGLGVVALDADGDGWMDLYVANDMEPNQLWMNEEGRGFREDALLAGTSVNAEGAAEASMGIAIGDLDLDGDEDLVLTHLAGETHTLYRNVGNGFFRDETGLSRLSRLTVEATGFGTALADLDRDGDLDLVVANGAVTHIEEQVRAGDPLPLRQRNQLFENLGAGVFQAAPALGGPPFEALQVSRGLAAGDLDNDGDTDLVVTNNNEPVQLLVNEGPPSPWVGLSAVTDSRPALGALVVLVTTERRELSRRVRTDGSYASASDARVLFALKQSEGVEAVTIHWPSGDTESWGSLALGQYHELSEGGGRSVP